MKFTIQKDEFLKFLQFADDIISTKNTMSILSNILLETSDGNLKIIATDIKTIIKINLNAQQIQPGSTTILARKLIEIIRELPNDDIEITLDNENFVNIKSKAINGNYKIKSIPKEDYPVIPEIKKDNIIHLPQQVLKRMIKKTIFAVSKDDTTQAISGVKLELKNNKLRFVATDARRLSLIDHLIETNVENLDAIIPFKVLSELLKILQDEGDIKIGITENQIYFEVGNIELISQLIDGKFPDYNQVIPTSFEKQVTFEKDKIFDAVRRVSTMANEKQTSKIIMRFSNNFLELFASDPDIGEGKESMQIEYNYDDFEIAFSSEFLIDAFKVIETDNLIMSFNNNLSAVLIKEEKNDNFICLVMPIRIN